MKGKAVQLRFVPAINEAIANKKIIWIKYHTKGGKDGCIWAVKPEKWKNEPLSFLAVCQKDFVTKKYCIERVADLHDSHWIE